MMVNFVRIITRTRLPLGRNRQRILDLERPIHSRNNATTTGQTPSEYCVNLVRKYDYENYLCTLLLPPTVRSTAFAVRAFNVEIAQVEDQVRDNSIGKMRFKFWEDSLDKIYKGAPPRSPVALELHRAIAKHKLSKRYLKRLIDARSEQLTATMFLDMKSVEDYSEYTVSSIYYLLLGAANVQDLHVDHAASHLGKSHGITNMIRSVLHNAQKRCVALPQDVLIKHNLAAESVIRGQSRKELSNAVFEVASRAKLHLDKARKASSNVPKIANSIFMPAKTIDLYLETLRRADFDIHHPVLRKRDNLLSLKLYWHHFCNRSF